MGTDHQQEWLLPWWWNHYSARNSYPVLFVDFGMSPNALAFCQERGALLPLREQLLLKEPPPKMREVWEEHFGKTIWQRRPHWFKKPLALFQAPFETGIWLDLDCEVRASLQPLFNCMNLGLDFALKPEPKKLQDHYRSVGLALPQELICNSGVIVYRKEAAILRQWVEEARERSDLYPGDQEALSRAIFQTNAAYFPLPEIYNWYPLLGAVPPDVLIVHYRGEFQKKGLGNAQQSASHKPLSLEVVKGFLDYAISWGSPVTTVAYLFGVYRDMLGRALPAEILKGCLELARDSGNAETVEFFQTWELS